MLRASPPCPTFGVPTTGAAVPPVGQTPPAAQPGLEASAWQVAWSDGAAETAALAWWLAEPECSVCLVHGAAACASRDAHIGTPPPAAATTTATAAATARAVRERRRGRIADQYIRGRPAPVPQTSALRSRSALPTGDHYSEIEPQVRGTVAWVTFRYELAADGGRGHIEVEGRGTVILGLKPHSRIGQTGLMPPTVG